MEYNLKSISKAGIPEAIAKVKHYRSLNEPEEAESICRDILAVEPQHQLALRLLGLAITDQFLGASSDRYEQLYYTGILYERRAKVRLRNGHLAHAVLPLFGRALECFGEAEKIRPAGNDDSILRWNRCVRLLQAPGYAWEEEFVSFEPQDMPPA